MPLPTISITPDLQEMGVMDTALIITRFDEDTEEVHLELCVRTKRHLSPKQARDLEELMHSRVEVAATAFASVFHHMTRGGDLTVNIQIGVYKMEDGE